MASGPIISWEIDGETVEIVSDLWWGGGAPESLQMVTAAMKLRHLLTPWKKSYDQPKQHIEKQRHYISDKFLHSRSYGFSSNHVYGCESWTLKKAEQWRIDAFEL